MSLCSAPQGKRVFSGKQPSGSLHLGNYLGAIVNFVALQKDFECIYCVVDLHAVTLPYKPEELKQTTREIVAGFIASGIDEERSILFNQSQVDNHAVLSWILNCVARIGWLNRMTQFKDKAGRNRENASVGLFTYPVLMAADILCYRATHVPVGDDQKQHLELARDLAGKFNTDFAERIGACGLEEAYFPLPEPIIDTISARIMSLRDGTKKMSSSDLSDYSRLNMLDDADAITLKLRKARTDAYSLPSTCEGLEGRPEVANLVTIYAALTSTTLQNVLEEYGGAQLSVFKQALIDLAVAKMEPIGREMRRLLAAPDHIDALLCKGAEKARGISDKVVRDVKEVMGFIGTGKL